MSNACAQPSDFNTLSPCGLDCLETSNYNLSMTARETLLAEIEAFLERHDLRPTTFGRLASNDTALVSRIRNGANVRLDTADALRLFMQCYKPPKPRRARGNDLAAA